MAEGQLEGHLAGPWESPGERRQGAVEAAITGTKIRSLIARKNILVTSTRRSLPEAKDSFHVEVRSNIDDQNLFLLQPSFLLNEFSLQNAKIMK